MKKLSHLALIVINYLQIRGCGGLNLHQMASNLKANEAGPSPRMAALTRERRQAAEEDGAGEQMVDVANNQANMFMRNNLANMAAAADILENWEMTERRRRRTESQATSRPGM